MVYKFSTSFNIYVFGTYIYIQYVYTLIKPLIPITHLSPSKTI